MGADGQALPTGRLWGTLGDRSKLPISFEVVRVHFDDYIKLRRILRRLTRPKERRWRYRGIPRDRLTNQKVLLRYETSKRMLAWLGYSVE